MIYLISKQDKIFPNTQVNDLIDLNGNAMLTETFYKLSIFDERNSINSTKSKDSKDDDKQQTDFFPNLTQLIYDTAIKAVREDVLEFNTETDLTHRAELFLNYKEAKIVIDKQEKSVRLEQLKTFAPKPSIFKSEGNYSNLTETGPLIKKFRNRAYDLLYGRMREDTFRKVLHSIEDMGLFYKQEKLAEFKKSCKTPNENASEESFDDLDPSFYMEKAYFEELWNFDAIVKHSLSTSKPVKCFDSRMTAGWKYEKIRELQQTHTMWSSTNDTPTYVFPWTSIEFEEAEYYLAVDISSLTDMLRNKVLKRLSLKVRKNVRIAMARLFKFLKEQYPTDAYKDMASIVPYDEISIRNLDLCYKNSTHLKEFRSKAPALGYVYLHLLSNLKDFIATGVKNAGEWDADFFSDHNAEKMKLAYRAVNLLETQGIAGLHQLIVKDPKTLARKMRKNVAPDVCFHTVLGNPRHELTDSQWKTLCKLPSARWTEKLYYKIQDANYPEVLDMLSSIKYIRSKRKFPKLAFFTSFMNTLWHNREEFMEKHNYPIERLWNAYISECSSHKVADIEFKQTCQNIGQALLTVKPADKNAHKSGWKWLSKRLKTVEDFYKEKGNTRMDPHDYYVTKFPERYNGEEIPF